MHNLLPQGKKPLMVPRVDRQGFGICRPAYTET